MVRENDASIRNLVPDISASQFLMHMRGNPALNFLVDVRTQAEWNFIGLPLIDDRLMECQPVILIEWISAPDYQMNIEFAATLETQLLQAWLSGQQDGQSSKSGSMDELKEMGCLYFICRSGARSRSAAESMIKSGFKNCNNIAGGFEGDLDENLHRGNINGWKAEGLPWRQS